MRLTTPKAPRMPKISDSITLGIIGGLVATLTIDLSSSMLWRKGKEEATFSHLAGSILMSGIRTNRPKNYALGKIVHTITGTLMGIPLVYLFKLTGKDRPLVKGAAYGSLAWMVLYVFGERFGVFSSKARLTKSHYSIFFNNILYGLVSAITIVSLGHPSVFSNNETMMHPEIERNSTRNTEWMLPDYEQREIDHPVH